MAVRFHGILLVRDEADILCEVLDHLLTWCDALHVLDTGSEDGSWDIVQEAKKRDARLGRVERVECLIAGDTRGHVWERVRDSFAPGDWVARLDADEIYHVPPPQFVRECVRPHEGRIFAQEYEFMFTHADMAAWERGERAHTDRARPLTERRRWYVPEPVVECRLFKYERGMRWGRGQPNPYFAGLPARERIAVRHYRWRDPVQMERRCLLRDAVGRLTIHGVHWHKPWREWLWDERDPRLREWKPGMELERVEDASHLGGAAKAALRRGLYASGVAGLLRQAAGLRAKPVELIKPPEGFTVARGELESDVHCVA